MTVHIFQKRRLRYLFLLAIFRQQFSSTITIANAWVVSISNLPIQRQWRQGRQHSISPTVIHSTPFEASLYDNNDDSNRKTEIDSCSLVVPSDTKLVIGMNKYSHDTSICFADSKTGKVLIALSKERISRKKHDSGNVASLMETCMDALNVTFDNIETVVMNNHHHRILPMERNRRHMEWESGLGINGGSESGYDEPENTFYDSDDSSDTLSSSTITIARHELSHHLAHAYSAATQSPFPSGLCVIMDGMGETFRTMQHAIETSETAYTSDLSFGIDTFQCIPSDIVERSKKSIFDWREAESVYVFDKTNSSIDIRPIFKRFTQENTPPTLYNHGFENMDSVGALYSRASSHIFGDWNACGKVMGLAPWAKYTWKVGSDTTLQQGLIQSKLHTSKRIMWGKLYSENENERFEIDRSLLEGIPHIARTDPDLFNIDGTLQKKRYDFDDDEDNDGDEEQSVEMNQPKERQVPTKVALDAIAVADRIQIDLEDVILDFVRHFKNVTKTENLCVAGGVALNSVLNGRLAREIGFKETFIPPYPGDDGIAIGCCAFGLFGNIALQETKSQQLTLTSTKYQPPMWQRPLSPYLGPMYTEEEIKMAIEDAMLWLDVEVVHDSDERLQIMANEVQKGAVIAWFQSRSELGPRALGHRSIIADPRKKGLVRFINQHVKSRESFRPFAPSVLAEHAPAWFDFGETDIVNVSPFMSMTAIVHTDKRRLVPAVTHVDGSSRMQTVTEDDEPLYHKFITRFFELTGVPMVLNTSFNTLPSEPIVESPKDAIRSFLYSMGSIEMLVLGDYIIRRKKPDLQKLLGEVTKSGLVKTQPVCPKRAGSVQFQSTFELSDDETNSNSEDGTVVTITKVRMPDRPMHGIKNEWVELLDELEGEILAVCDGSVTLNEIMAQYSPPPNDEKDDDNDPDTDTDGQTTGHGDENRKTLVQNIVHRLVRLNEETLIGW